MELPISDRHKEWLDRLAKANDTSVERILDSLVQGLVDYAGDRPVSWEAEMIERITSPLGVWNKPPFDRELYDRRWLSGVNPTGEYPSDG